MYWLCGSGYSGSKVLRENVKENSNSLKTVWETLRALMLAYYQGTVQFHITG